MLRNRALTRREFKFVIVASFLCTLMIIGFALTVEPPERRPPSELYRSQLVRSYAEIFESLFDSLGGLTHRVVDESRKITERAKELVDTTHSSENKGEDPPWTEWSSTASIEWNIKLLDITELLVDRILGWGIHFQSFSFNYLDIVIGLFERRTDPGVWGTRSTISQDEKRNDATIHQPTASSKNTVSPASATKPEEHSPSQSSSPSSSSSFSSSAASKARTDKKWRSSHTSIL